MRRKKTLAYDEHMLKDVEHFANFATYRQAARATFEDLLICWGLCQSVFGAAAKPEHAISLLPSFLDHVDDLDDGKDRPTSKPSLDDEEEDEEDDDDDDDEDEGSDDEDEEDDED